MNKNGKIWEHSVLLGLGCAWISWGMTHMDVALLQRGSFEGRFGATFLPLCLFGVRRNSQRADTAVTFLPDFGRRRRSHSLDLQEISQHVQEDQGDRRGERHRCAQVRGNGREGLRVLHKGQPLEKAKGLDLSSVSGKE